MARPKAEAYNTIYARIDAELHERVRAVADAQDMTMTELVQRALRAYVAKAEKGAGTPKEG